VSELFLCDRIQSNHGGEIVYQEAIILTLSSPTKGPTSPCTFYGSTAKEFPSYPAQQRVKDVHIDKFANLKSEIPVKVHKPGLGLSVWGQFLEWQTSKCLDQ
jgi:hypothetical protein